MDEFMKKNEKKSNKILSLTIFLISSIIILFGIGALVLSDIYNDMNLASISLKESLSGNSARPWEIPLQAPVKLIYEIGRPLIPISIILFVIGALWGAKNNPSFRLPLIIFGIFCICGLIFS